MVFQRMVEWSRVLLVACSLGGGTVSAADALPVERMGEKKPLEAVDIGLPESLFQGIPKAFVEPLSTPFRKLMKDQTGLEGNIRQLPNAMAAAAGLHEGKIHLAVFQGHEFAWAKAKYPDLEPIALAIPQNRTVQSYLVVRWDCKADNIGGLDGCKLIIPPGTKDFTKLFLEQQKASFMKKGGFAQQLKASTVVDALEDIIEGNAEATVVDATALNYYQQSYPGRYKNLKILSESIVFPLACVAVKKGELDASTVQKFQDALINAAKQPQGQRMMTLWKLQRFDKVPETYEKELKQCNSLYPQNLAAAVNARP